MTASAEILIAPTRVVLERGERSAELVIVNKGDEDAAFRISIENRRMRKDGSMEEAETAVDGELFATDFLRYAPRRVILEPGGRQTIRVSARPTADMQPGEYRSHLRLMGAPLSAGRTLESVVDGPSDDLSIQLIAIRSITIPLILRVGELDAEIEIEGVETAPSDVENEMLLIARLARTGTKSTYGDIKLFVDGRSEPVYFARGIAVYTPNAERDVILPLPDAVRSEIAGRPVRMVYQSSDPAAPEVYAEYRTTLP